MELEFYFWKSTKRYSCGRIVESFSGIRKVLVELEFYFWKSTKRYSCGRIGESFSGIRKVLVELDFLFSKKYEKILPVAQTFSNKTFLLGFLRNIFLF